MKYILSFYKIEFIKTKKNISLIIFSLTLILISTILTFLLHLQRVGLSGNQNIPLNFSYGGYAVWVIFHFYLLTFCIFIDSEIREEIKSNKINILFTQAAIKYEYYLGKIIFWTTLVFFMIIILNIICWSLSINLIFANRPPRLNDNSIIPTNFIFLNLLIQILLLIPVILFFINLSFISGFFFSSSAAGIIFNILLIILAITNRTLLLYPLYKTFFPFQTLSIPKIFDSRSLIYLIFTSISNIIFLFIVKIFIPKREFK